MQGVLTRRLPETSFAVIDLETTGFSPGNDRVLELSVVRLDPGEPPRLAFDSLVNPCRAVEASDIHGIAEEDVSDAPRFGEIARGVLDALDGCVVAAYNASFDARFLHWELRNAGITQEAPHLCVMSLRTLVGLGQRCRLGEACREAGIEAEGSHIASSDAFAAAKLLRLFLARLHAHGVERFEDFSLRLRSRSRFVESFVRSPLPSGEALGLTPCAVHRSRGARVHSTPGAVRRAMQEYCDALTTVLLDLDVTDAEMEALEAVRESLGLQREHIRMLHGRLFAGAVMRFSEDEWLDDIEANRLQRLHTCLSRLGWAPGQ